MGRHSSTSAKEDQDRAGLHGTLAIGFFASICRNHLGDTLLAFARECPQVELGVHEMTRAALLPALGKGELALVILPETEHPGHESLELWQDRVMVAMPEGHPMACHPGIAPDRLAQEIFLVSREQHGGEMHRFLSHRILPHEPSLNTVLLDLSPSLLMAEVAAGRGVLLVCGSHSDQVGPGVVLRPVDAADARFSVCAYWDGDPPEDALAVLIQMLGNVQDR